MPYKVDLHTHSEQSYDGVMNADHYKRILAEGLLDYVAITDHNEIDNALRIQQMLGEKIIVGEEIKTDKGDLIGLFLEKKIPKGTSLVSAAEQIKEQGGLIYVPHPFDVMRSGIKLNELNEILTMLDIVEGFNARYIYPGGNSRAMQFGLSNQKAIAAGSDSHSFGEIGRTFNLFNEAPERESLVHQIKESTKVTKYVKPLYYLNPKRNRVRKLFKKYETS